MKLKNYLRKQPPMRRVVLACMPPLLGGMYFFGWRSLAMFVVACLAAVLTEHLFCRLRKEPVSEAALVTGSIYALIMPPTVPWHVLVIGVVFAIVFAKEVFGGFGRNIFNPAMVGRAFVYIAFPVSLTAHWAPVAPVSGEHWWGALDRWSTERAGAGSVRADQADPYAVTDAYTGATPLAETKRVRLEIGHLENQLGRLEPQALAERQRYQQQLAQARARLEQVIPPYERLFMGNLSGTMGVTSVLLILIGGTYLFWTRTANRTLIVTVTVAYFVFSQFLYWLGVQPVPDGLRAVMGGGFLFGAFYMVTDPISAPKTHHGRIAFAILIALGTVVIRNFSVFNGGLMFALLLGNMYAPIMDYLVNQRAARKKTRQSQQPPAQKAKGAGA